MIKQKKAQIGNLIINTMLAAIGLVIFIAAYPAWKAIFNVFLSGSSNLAANIVVKVMPFFAFAMFVILFFSIFYFRQ